jgi:type I restriction enzyme, S subunit
MSLSTYSQYKQVGIPWLGELPQHWSVKKIKHSTYLKGRVGWKGLTSEEYLDDGYAYLVTGTDFTTKFIDWRTCHCVDKARYEDDPFIQLQNGDLLITKDGTIGKLAIIAGLDRPACLNSGIFLVRPKSDYTTEFMFWLLQSECFERFCDLSSMGSTIQHLYQNVFENFSFPVPNGTEQRAIAGFLTREIGKIDALIAEQQRLLELLAEKRLATISHAVARGLNPKVPMKDSGVEWLGLVPSHWDAVPLKHLCQLLKDGTHLPPPRVDIGVPLLSVRNINDSAFALREDDSMISRDDYSELCRAFSPMAGDVLMAIVGATLGKVAVIPDGLVDFHIQRSLAIFRPSEKLQAKWLFYCISSRAFQRLLWENAGFSAQPGIYLGTLKEFKIPLPSSSEQLALCDFLDSELMKLDSVRVESESAIDLLRERRGALIAAAVTGKIDVRNDVPEELAA